MARKVIFLDRDGTINEEVRYLHRSEELRIIPGVPEALRRLRELGFLLVLVTNQAGIARGYYTEADCERLNAYLNETLRREGAGLDRVYYCPHHPEKGIGVYRRDCDCRKPKPGMLRRAAEELQLGRFENIPAGETVDRAHSYMLGDKRIDTIAGHNFGIQGILLGSGYGRTERELAAPGDYDAYFESMGEAVGWIEKRERDGS